MYPEEPMKRSLNVVRYSDSVKVQKRSSRGFFTSDPLPGSWGGGGGGGGRWGDCIKAHRDIE